MTVEDVTFDGCHCWHGETWIGAGILQQRSLPITIDGEALSMRTAAGCVKRGRGREGRGSGFSSHHRHSAYYVLRSGLPIQGWADKSGQNCEVNGVIPEFLILTEPDNVQDKDK